jgi:hypothetical protein
MKKLIAILFLAFAIQSHGATMFGTFTNYLGQPDTNSFLIYRLGGATARADGTWVTAGPPTRITPQTNGYWETSLQVGNYMATNASLAPGIVFRVPDDHGGNSYSIWSNRLSGYNTFVTLVYGDNPPPTFGQITNALNGKPVFQEELDAAIVSVTNGFTSIVRSNASVFLHTNALPALTNGFVRSDITNLSATISLLNTSSNSLRTALTSTINTASNANHVLILAATNGLARTTITNGLVSQAEINAASNSLRTSLTSTINTASNQNHTLIVSATNGLARTTITNGLVSQTEINTSSNALRTSLIGTINTTSNALWQEIGTGSGGAGTNYVDAQVAASTNSLRTSLITVINSSSNANRSFAIDATNGLARLTDTNGFVRQANIDASSNSLRSSLVSVINTASNDTRDFAVNATNGLRHALSSAMTVTNLSFSGNPFMRRDTNIVAVYSAGNTTNNGTYVWESGLYRKTVGPGSIYFVNPTWFMEDGSAVIYSASSPVGPWSIVSGSGPVPTSEYGYYVDLSGAVFRGVFVSTNFFYAVTNGFQSATNYARVATNVLNSNLTALINTASNANRDFAITVTNGFSIGITNGLAGTNYVVSAVNTASNSIRVDLSQKVTTTNITIGTDLVIELSTNVLSVTGAGTPAANGTYVWNPDGFNFTNSHTGSYVTNNSGDFVIRSVGHASLYSSSTLIADNYTLGSGDSPSPTVTYGQRLDLSGMEFYGAIHSTNLDARIAAGTGNAASLNGLPGSAYVTNGGTANVTATNTLFSAWSGQTLNSRGVYHLRSKLNTRTNALRIMVLGDSVAAMDYGGKIAGIYPILTNLYGVTLHGSLAGNYPWLYASGTQIDSHNPAYSTPWSTNWWSGYFLLTNGASSSATILADTANGPSGNTTSVYCDTASVTYKSGTGEGSFVIQTNVNGGSFATALTINASATTGTIVTNIALPLGYHQMKLVGSSGSVTILSYGMWEENSGNVVVQNMEASGMTLTNFTALSTNITYPWLRASKPDLLLVEWKDNAESISNGLVALKAALDACSTNTDVVCIGTTPCATGDDEFAIPQNAMMRALADQYGWYYWDGYNIGLTYAQATGLGMTRGDDTHFSRKGAEILGQMLWADLIRYSPITPPLPASATQFDTNWIQSTSGGLTVLNSLTMKTNPAGSGVVSIYIQDGPGNWGPLMIGASAQNGTAMPNWYNWNGESTFGANTHTWNNEANSATLFKIVNNSGNAVVTINTTTNTTGSTVVGQLPVTINGVVYYIDLKRP